MGIEPTSETWENTKPEAPIRLLVGRNPIYRQISSLGFEEMLREVAREMNGHRTMAEQWKMERALAYPIDGGRNALPLVEHERGDYVRRLH